MKPPLLLLNLLRVALFLCPFAAPAEDWSRFRGPNGSGISKDTGFPAKFGKDENAVWRTPVRPGKSSPILTDRHIFLTAFEEGKLFTQCFDRKTGKLLWERSEMRPRQEVKNVRNESAVITPVTDGESVYVFFPELGLLSYDLAGNLRWKVPLGPFTNTMGLSASPILAGDSIVILADQNEDSYISAFNRRNGEIQWKTAREEKDGWATPLLYRPRGGALQVVTVSRSQLGTHRSDTGARTLTYKRLSPAIVASPILDQDTLFTFGYGHDTPAPFDNALGRLDKNKDGMLSPDEYGNDAFIIGMGKYEGNRDGIVTRDEWEKKYREVVAPSSLLAIRLERAADRVRFREIWRYERNFVGVIPSPLLYNGILYLIKNGGILTSFDAKTGDVLKAARVEGAIGGYSASPVAADGKIYLASEDGKISVVQPGREWEVLAVSDLGEGFWATPALSAGNVYLRSTEALYCFASSGK